MTTDLTPRDWLLLLFSDAGSPLDRVRIQKAMFLFAERSKAPAREKYTFKPYHYGPFSSAIYADLDAMVAGGVLKEEFVPWTRSPRYRLTQSGADRAAQLGDSAPADRRTLLIQLRDWVLAQSFESLLKQVYRLYPEYATRSVFSQT